MKVVPHVTLPKTLDLWNKTGTIEKVNGKLRLGSKSPLIPDFALLNSGYELPRRRRDL